MNQNVENQLCLNSSNVSANEVKSNEGVLGIVFKLSIKIRQINIEGDYAQDVILPILFEHQICQGISQG